MSDAKLDIKTVVRTLKKNLHPQLQENYSISENKYEPLANQNRDHFSRGSQGHFYKVKRKDATTDNQQIYGAKQYNDQFNSIPLILDEFKMLSKIKSDFIFQVYDVSKINDGICLISNFFSQGALYDKKLKKFPGNIHKLVFLATFANSIWYLHSQKDLIIHHDIKPLNLCLETRDIDGKTYFISELIDFGLCKRNTLLTNHEATELYVIRFNHHYTIESDICSLLLTMLNVLGDKMYNFLTKRDLHAVFDRVKEIPFVSYILSLFDSLFDNQTKEIVPSMAKIMLIFTNRRFFEYFFKDYLNNDEVNEYFKVIEKLDVYPKYIDSFENFAQFLFNTPEMVKSSSIEESVQVNFFYNGETIVESHTKCDQYSISAAYNTFFFALFHQLGYVYNPEDFDCYQKALLQIVSEAEQKKLGRLELIEKIANFHVDVNFFDLQENFHKFHHTCHANRKLFQILIMLYIQNPSNLYHFNQAIQFQFNGIVNEQLKTIQISFGKDHLAKFAFLCLDCEPTTNIDEILYTLFEAKYSFKHDYTYYLSQYFTIPTSFRFSYDDCYKMSFDTFVKSFEIPSSDTFNVNDYTQKFYQLIKDISITNEMNQKALLIFGCDYELILLYLFAYDSFKNLNSLRKASTSDYLSDADIDFLIRNSYESMKLTSLFQSDILSNKHEILTKLCLFLSLNEFDFLKNISTATDDVKLLKFKNSNKEVTLSRLNNPQNSSNLNDSINSDVVNEFRILNNLTLPYIIKTHGVVLISDSIYIVKDYYKKTLFDYLPEKSLTINDLSKIIVRLTYCLAYLESLNLLQFLNSIDPHTIYLTNDLIPIVYDFSFNHNSDIFSEYFDLISSLGQLYSDATKNSMIFSLQNVSRSILSFQTIFRFLTSKYFHTCFNSIDYEQYQQFIDSEFRFIFDENQYKSMFVELFGSNYHFILRNILDSKYFNPTCISYETFCKTLKTLFDQQKLKEIGEFYETNFTEKFYLHNFFRNSFANDSYRINDSSAFENYCFTITNDGKYDDATLSYLFHLDNRFVANLTFCDKDKKMYFNTPYIPFVLIKSDISQSMKIRFASSLQQSLLYLDSCDETKLLDIPFNEKVIYVTESGESIILPIKIKSSRDHQTFVKILIDLFNIRNCDIQGPESSNQFNFPTSIKSIIIDSEIDYFLNENQIRIIKRIFGLNYQQEISKLNKNQIDYLVGHFENTPRFYFLYAFNFDFDSPLFHYLMNKAVELRSEEAKNILDICDNLQNYVVHFDDIQQFEQVGFGAYSIIYKCKYDNQIYAYKALKPEKLYKNCFSNITEFLIYQAIIFKQEKASKFILEEYKISEFGILMKFCNNDFSSMILNSAFDIKMKFIYLIGEGLSLIHSKGFLHRDIKPQNILLNENYSVIADLSDLVPQLHTDVLFTGTDKFRTKEIMNLQTGDTIDNDIDCYLKTISYILIKSSSPKIVKQNRIEYIEADGHYYQTSLHPLFAAIGKKNFKIVDDILLMIKSLINQGNLYLIEVYKTNDLIQSVDLDNPTFIKDNRNVSNIIRNEIELIDNPESAVVNENDLNSLYSVISNKNAIDLTLIDQIIDVFVVNNENPDNPFANNKPMYESKYSQSEIESFSKYCVLIRYKIAKFDEIDVESSFFKFYVNILGQISIEFVKCNLNQIEIPVEKKYLHEINFDLIASIALTLLVEKQCLKSSIFYILLLFNQNATNAFMKSAKFRLNAILSVYHSSLIDIKYRDSLVKIVKQFVMYPPDDIQMIQNILNTKIFQNEKYLDLMELFYSTMLKNISFCPNSYLDLIKENYEFLKENENSNPIIKKFYLLVQQYYSPELENVQPQIYERIIRFKPPSEPQLKPKKKFDFRQLKK